MHDRQTFLCVACGGRQPPAERCARCGDRALADLTDPGARVTAHRTWHERWARRQSRRLYRSAPSAKRALAAFLGGGALTLGGGFFLAALEPALLVGPAVIASVCAAVGASSYWLWPRSLVDSDKRAIDREVQILAQQALAPIDRLPLPEGPCEGAEALTGEVVGTGAPPLFAPGPAVLERVVGEGAGGSLDDARAVPFDLRVAPDEVVRVEPEGWMVSIDCPLNVDTALTAAQREYLEARGARTDRTTPPLRAGHIGPGDRVTVEGLVEERSVPGGYRGSRVVRRVGGPWARVRRAAPS